MRHLYAVTTLVRKLELKVGITITVGLIITALLLLFWKPMVIIYYSARLESKNNKDKIDAITHLLGENSAGKAELRSALKISEEECDFISESWHQINGILPNHNDLYPLIAAAECGYLTSVKLLLIKGAEINAQDILSNNSALHLASFEGHLEIAKILIANGADVNIRKDGGVQENTGTFPIHYAAMNGHNNVVKLLIANDAKVNVRDFGDFTPLHFALIHQSHDVVETLVKLGADVNIVDDAGRSPLHYAESIASIKLLLENGSDVNALDSEGKTPLDYAISLKNPEAIDLLLSYKAKTGDDLRNGKKQEDVRPKW